MLAEELLCARRGSGCAGRTAHVCSRTVAGAEQVLDKPVSMIARMTSKSYKEGVTATVFQIRELRLPGVR